MRCDTMDSSLLLFAIEMNELCIDGVLFDRNRHC